MALAADLDEEGIEVDVHDAGGHGGRLPKRHAWRHLALAD
jgi:hypothetical protein